MTVSRISTRHAYVGVSGDTKPASGVPAGSTFVERDTGHEFIFDGAEWAQKFFPRAPGAGGGVDAPIITVVEPVTNPPAFDTLVTIIGSGAVLAGDDVQYRFDGDTDSGNWFTHTLTQDDINNGFEIVTGTLAAGSHYAEARIRRGDGSPGTIYSAWSAQETFTAPASYTEQGVIFDGTNDYLNISSNLGAADGSTLLFASVDFTSTAALDEYIFVASLTSQFAIWRDSSGYIHVYIAAVGGGAAIDFTSAATVGAERCNVVVGYTPSGNAQVYLWTDTAGSWIEGLNASASSSNADNTRSNWAIGGSTAGFIKLAATYYRATFWSAITVPDLSSSAVRDNFANSSTGALVDPATSVSAYGTPLVDYYGAVSDWVAGNNGSAGDYTINGTLVDA